MGNNLAASGPRPAEAVRLYRYCEARGAETIQRPEMNCFAGLATTVLVMKQTVAPERRFEVIGLTRCLVPAFVIVR